MSQPNKSAFDVAATQDAIDLLEEIIVDPDLTEKARFIVARVLNRLDHELRGELVREESQGCCSKQE
jgi:uncharacterized protein (UPF0147 family)